MKIRAKLSVSTLRYIKDLILVFLVTICLSITIFASLVDVSKGIMNSAIGLNIFAVIAKIKKV